LIPLVIANQGTHGIDTSTGATFTSKGFIEAVNLALAQAQAGLTAAPAAEAPAAPAPAAEAPAAPAAPAEPEPVQARFNPGTFTARADGFEEYRPNNVTVTITVNETTITDIEFTSDDTPMFVNMVRPLVDIALANQSADGLDTRTGATETAEGFVNALRAAIAQAER